VKKLIAPLSLCALLGCVNPSADLIPVGQEKYVDYPGHPGFKLARLEGDPERGPAHFFLKLASGVTLGKHHHSADHYATVVSGNLVVTVNPGPMVLEPGSYFSFLGRTDHAIRCAPPRDCVLFIDARGKWDWVMAAAP
jgi:hypothetical protein